MRQIKAATDLVPGDVLADGRTVEYEDTHDGHTFIGVGDDTEVSYRQFQTVALREVGR